MDDLKPSPITPTVDFDRDGVQHGHLKLPYSHDEGAYSCIMIPITVIRNGDGPCALLSAGNHGDEYEGQISLRKLAENLHSEEISGTVIITPAMNFPAAMAAKRTSPIDKCNMNRIYPGRPDGSVTEKIADYFNRFLLPRAEYVLDLHSGGKTLDFVPHAAVHVLADKHQQEKCTAAMMAFGAPYSMICIEMDPVGLYDGTAEDMGKIFVSSELGGGGTATAESVAITDRGVRNFLIHAGILSGEIQHRESQLLEMPDPGCFITCERGGLLEICADLGTMLETDDLVARVYDMEHTGQPAREYRTTRPGMLASRHFPGLIRTGDNLAIIADVLN